MKKIVLFFAALGACAVLNAQDLVMNFQKKYEKDAEFTVVNITAKMFQLIGAMANEDEQSIINDLNGLKVLNTSKNPHKHYENFVSMVDGTDYEELMSVEEKQEKVRMFTQEKNGLISSLIIATQDESEFSLIGISGSIDLKKISSLSKTLNLDKLEKLDRIPD